MAQSDVGIVQHFFDPRARGRLVPARAPRRGRGLPPHSGDHRGGERRGRQAFRRYLEDFFGEAWSDDVGFGATSFRERGECVIVRVELHGHGRTSGLELSGRVFQVFTLRDGVIVRIEDFIDRAQALQAAGHQE